MLPDAAQWSVLTDLRTAQQCCAHPQCAAARRSYQLPVCVRPSILHLHVFQTICTSASYQLTGGRRYFSNDLNYVQHTSGPVVHLFTESSANGCPIASACARQSPSAQAHTTPASIRAIFRLPHVDWQPFGSRHLPHLHAAAHAPH